MVCDQGWAKIYQSSRTGFIGLVDEKRGMHQFTEKKAVILSFILDDVDGWYQYAKKNNLLIDLDPEGYQMQFIYF